MSDFSKLLGKLQDTAKSAKRSEASNSLSSTRKRKICNHSEMQQIIRRKGLEEEPKPKRPCDYADLSVQVSFLCIGAQKAGTTWLHEMLKRHQGIALPVQKEVHFWDWHRARGLRWYSNQFPQTFQNNILGEITPCYAVLKSEQISEIKYMFPEVKIIFLARDLVDRAWSAILMEMRNAAMGLEVGQFASDNQKMDKRTKLRYLREADPNQYDDNYFMDRLMHATHRERSEYASSIREWLKYYPKEQILILNYKDVSERPRELLKTIGSFIGVNDDFANQLTEEEISKRFNAAPDSNLRQAIRPGLRIKMEQVLRPLAQDFNTLLLELGYTWGLNDYKK